MNGYAVLNDYFRSQVPEAFSKNTPEVDTLIVDVSALLEDIFKTVFQARAGSLPNDTLEIEFYTLIPQRINDLVRMYLPREVLMLALDGVMSVLEMQGLKQKSYYRSLTRATEIVDSAGLLPGTDWMFKIKNQLAAFPTDAALRPYETIISHMTSPGSALEKILAHIRGHGQHSSLIVCSDPERMHLLLLGALLSPHEIYLTTNGKEYVSIRALRAFLTAAKGEAAPDEAVILFLLLGSSIHPAVPACTVSTLYNAYVDFSEIFIAQDGGTRYIDWQVLARLLSTLSASEPTRLAEVALRSANGEYKYAFIMAEQAIVNGKFYLNLFRAPWYRRALGVRDESLALTIGALLGTPTPLTPPTITQVQDMASDYLITLGWLYLFLQGGKVDKSWLYRYHHAPLCTDITLIARNADSIYLYGYRGIVNESFTPHIMHQLTAVLPYVSRAILPEELRSLFEVDSPLFPLTPAHFIVEHEAKRSPHEGTIIPFIELSKVALAWSLNIVKSDKSRVTVEKDYVYHLSASQLNNRKGLIENELAARKLAQDRINAQVEARLASDGARPPKARAPMGRGRGGKAPAPLVSMQPKAFPKASAPKPRSFSGRGSPKSSPQRSLSKAAPKASSSKSSSPSGPSPVNRPSFAQQRQAGTK